MQSACAPAAATAAALIARRRSLPLGLRCKALADVPPASAPRLQLPGAAHPELAVLGADDPDLVLRLLVELVQNLLRQPWPVP
eukprot:9681737-Lingulodinium_polyedra.AAC.1